jgi:predicted TIM-barrel fold metal-dependent hydrolase
MAPDQEDTELLDTHLHLIDRERLSYPWLTSLPVLDRNWSLETYAEVALPLGITGALHMEVDVAEPLIEAESHWIAEQMAQPGSLLRGAISSARPESAGFAEWLERQDRSIVRGLRRVLHVVDDAVSQSTLFRENLRRLGKVGLPFDICMLQRQLPLATALADACPDTVFVLDHCGVPDILGGDFAGWATAIRDLARRPNVNAKVSGITAYGGPDWTVETLRPYVEEVIGAFGWDRVVWGSDSPVCNLQGSLSRWIEATRMLIAGASQDERQAFSQGNASRIWHLPAT